MVLAERDDEALAQGMGGRGGGGAAPEATKEKTGLTLHNVSPEIIERYRLDEGATGALIVDVDPSSPAARSRLTVGDLIVEADRKPVRSVPDFNKIIAELDKEIVLLKVERAGSPFLATLKLDNE